MIYNVREIAYEGEIQVRVYESPRTRNIVIKSEKDINKNVCSSLTDEIEEQESSRHRDYAVESMSRTIQNIYGIGRANKWELFVTLTFDPNKCDNSNYSYVRRVTTKWLDNLKQRYCHDLRYLCVPELHSDGVKYHVHALLAGIDGLCLVDSGHCKDDMIVYNLPGWRYGFSTATKIQSSVRSVGYISKYITKDLCILTKGKQRYWASKNLLRIEDVSSYDFKEDIGEYVSGLLQTARYVKSSVCPDGKKVYYIEM